MRQNLALVVGLQGRFDEAEKIAGAELSPQQAQANVAYLEQMLAQRNTWQALKTTGKGQNERLARLKRRRRRFAYAAGAADGRQGVGDRDAALGNSPPWRGGNPSGRFRAGAARP